MHAGIPGVCADASFGHGFKVGSVKMKFPVHVSPGKTVDVIVTVSLVEVVPVQITCYNNWCFSLKPVKPLKGSIITLVEK